MAEGITHLTRIPVYNTVLNTRSFPTGVHNIRPMPQLAPTVKSHPVVHPHYHQQHPTAPRHEATGSLPKKRDSPSSGSLASAHSETTDTEVAKAEKETKSHDLERFKRLVEEEYKYKFQRGTYLAVIGEDCMDFHAREPWPQDVKLFQQYGTEQILLPDNANCLAVQAYLRMCGLQFDVEYRRNAEYMSPSGRVPFIKCGAFVVSELDPIIGFVNSKGVGLSDKLDPAQRADMRAYMSLVNTVLANAELYLTWVDPTTLKEVTKPRHGSVYPWPLNHFINWQKASQVKRRLAVLGWYQKTLDEVYSEVENCCNALSERLDNKEFFFGTGSELDCLVYGHLYALLTASLPLPDDQLVRIIREHENLTGLTQRMDKLCFGDMMRPHVDYSPLPPVLLPPLESCPDQNEDQLSLPDLPEDQWSLPDQIEDEVISTYQNGDQFFPEQPYNGHRFPLEAIIEDHHFPSDLKKDSWSPNHTTDMEELD